MAPRKRKAEAEPPATTPEKRVTRSATHAAMRLTRSGSKYGSTPISGSGSGSGSGSLEAEKKSDKKNAKKQGAEQSKTEVKVKIEKKEEEEQQEGGGASSSRPGKTIVIERCTQCKSFSERATEVKDGLEKKVPGITVKVNPEKPRKGCFEIREEGGQKFISLLNMKRPFKPMKDLDMDKVMLDIVDKINGQNTINGQDTVNGQGTTVNGQGTVSGQDTNH